MFDENLKLREAVFRKMGWDVFRVKTDVPGLYEWRHKATDEQLNYPSMYCDGPHFYDRTEAHFVLPPIEKEWEVTAKYLVPFMREKGMEYEMPRYGMNPKKITYFDWVSLGDSRHMYSRIEIKDDNISEAACRAFLEAVK